LEKQRKQSKPGNTLLDFTSLKTTLGGVWEDVQKEKTSTRQPQNKLNIFNVLRAKEKL